MRFHVILGVFASSQLFCGLMAQTLIPAACINLADGAQLVVQSVGDDQSRLCPSTSPFSLYLTALSSCAQAHSGDTLGARTPPSLLTSAQAFCAGSTFALTASSTLAPAQLSNSVLSICCGVSDGGLASLLSCPTITSSAIQCAPYVKSTTTSMATTSALNSTSTSTPTISSVVSATALSTPTPTPTPTPAPTNVGLTAGAAVGATLGFVLVVAFLGCCIWRRRKHRKAKRAAAAAAIQNREPEKAQLHSDDIKPKELEGPLLVPVRSVGGLEEMDGSDVAKSRFRVGEMPANEGVGSEMISEGTTMRGSEISRNT